MDRKTYLFGTSLFCDRLIESSYVKLFEIAGFFDNAPERWGKEKFGCKIERPYYSPEINVALAVGRAYHLEMITQLMELGYRRFTVYIKMSDGIYEKREYDYSELDYEKDRQNLVLLYLEHKSYSGICAIEYMCKNHLVDVGSFRVKVFNNKWEDIEYYYDLVTAKYVITERGWNHGYKIRAKKIQIWHGYPLKAMGRMLAEYKEEIHGPLNEFWNKFDYILSYGLNYTTFISACYGTVFRQYKVTGMPRNDLLFITDGKKNLNEKMSASVNKRIIMYMPTFRAIMESGLTQNGEEDGYLFYWENFDFQQMEDFCRKNNLFFIFKLHPSDASKVAQLTIQSEYMDILTDDMLGDKCMYEFLNAADILVTDYSSVYFDYLLLNRPIIFTDKDMERYAENRGIMLSPVEFWRPGAVVHTFDGFLDAIERILDGNDEYRSARERLMPFIHQYTDGKSTQRLFEILKNEEDEED